MIHLEEKPTQVLAKSNRTTACHAEFDHFNHFDHHREYDYDDCDDYNDYDDHDDYVDYDDDNLTKTVDALSQPWSKSSPKGPAVPVRL